MRVRLAKHHFVHVDVYFFFSVVVHAAQKNSRLRANLLPEQMRARRR
tara:strand:+ start:1252 stop:1392 length:141 start_codon:yes stop_codon:yes gene_type:complete